MAGAEPSTALVVYEYIITLNQEIVAVWKRRWNATSGLLISIRWVMVLSQILSWLTVWPNVRNIQWL